MIRDLEGTFGTSRARRLGLVTAFYKAVQAVDGRVVKDGWVQRRQGIISTYGDQC